MTAGPQGLVGSPNAVAYVENAVKPFTTTEMMSRSVDPPKSAKFTLVVIEPLPKPFCGNRELEDVRESPVSGQFQCGQSSRAMGPEKILPETMKLVMGRSGAPARPV